MLNKILMAVAGLLFAAGCAQQTQQSAEQGQQQAAQAQQSASQVHEWKMVTTWPKNFPGLGTGANFLAESIEKMSNGRITVQVYGAGELVGAFEVFDAVSRGTAELGHGASYYWRGKSEAAQFFAAVPFGLTAQEMNSWIYHGGGLELWEKIYGRFNLVPLAAGNTGVQMGGWFNKEINSLSDLRGLKMRIPGLGGEVLKRAGGEPIALPGGEIFSALETGAIDATEWVGPYNDLAFGFYKAARYYYYPGWHEPGTTLESMVNQDAFDALSPDLQEIVKAAARMANQDMLAEFTARNNRALQVLINEHNVQLRRYPQSVLNELADISNTVLDELAAGDADFREVYNSFRTFRDNAVQWHGVSELPYMEAREEALLK